MKAKSRVLLAAALCAALGAPAAAARRARKAADPRQGAIISSITVESHEVFDTAGSGRAGKLFYGLANSVHSKTSEAVVRRELLFSVGDRCDDALIKETERNLRRLGFLRRARITTVLNSRGMVDVIVRTYDAWSLEVIASFKRAGGVSSTKLGLAENNVLGEGKKLAATYARDGHNQSETFVWKDPQFLRKSHLEFETAVAARPGARNATVDLRRPFFASIARSSLGFAGRYNERDVKTFSEEGLETGAVHKQVGEAGVDYGVALGISTERARRLSTGVLFRRANYGYSPDQPPGPRPKPEQAIFFGMGAEWTELDFIKAQRIQKFSHDEDINLGFGLVSSVQWSPDGLHKLNSSESQVYPKVVVRKGFGDDQDLLLLRGGYSSLYVNETTGNRTVSGDVLYYHRGLPRQTLAFHAAYDHGWRLDPSALLTLGESNGLRGYGLSQFEGDRRMLFNFEDRLFIYDELFKLVDVGAVAFYDSGYVWPARHPVDLNELRHSVGVGLRLAPSRSGSNAPVRIDLARALNPNGTSSRWTLSILAGHAFGSDQP